VLLRTRYQLLVSKVTYRIMNSKSGIFFRTALYLNYKLIIIHFSIQFPLEWDLMALNLSDINSTFCTVVIFITVYLWTTIHTECIES